MDEGGDLWSHKPWWCQPWSILLTGAAVVAGSWWWLRLWWLTLPLALAVLAWWWLFLVLVPAAYRAEGEMGKASAPSPATDSMERMEPDQNRKR
jgi:1,4-dihydroxy-2-naphthoate octaprenyltransferase